jgi:porin
LYVLLSFSLLCVQNTDPHKSLLKVNILMAPPARARGTTLSPMLTTAVALLLAVVTLLGTGPARAETGTEGRAHDPGLLAWPPNVQSPYATGDLRGGRTWLEDRGLTLHFNYYGEVFWNARGGIRTTDDGGEYEGLLDLGVKFSTESAGLWKKGHLLFLFQNKHGEGITEEYVGAFQVLSNIDALDFTQVSELWYRQSFLDDRLWIKVGKQDANADFAGVEYGGKFINSSAGFSPTIPLPSYPDQDWGVALGIAPFPWFSVNLGAYNANPSGNRSLKGAFLDLADLMTIAEPAFHYGFGGRHGHIRVGGWFSGTNVDSPDENDPDPETYGEAYGWYLTWDQELWREHPEDDENVQGVGVFGQYGWAPPDRSAAEHYIGAGIRWAGMIPSLDEDVAGLGVFHVRFSDKANLEKDTETIIEAFYVVWLLGCLYLEPDLQYVINPGGTANPDALAVGLRFGVSL